jgi:hypothetical protein
MSLAVGASDDMDPPTITLPLLSTPSLSIGSVVRISGINYYTSTTTLTFGARSLELSNIYNILPYNPPPDFTYITISDSASSTPTTHNTFSLQFGASPYTSYASSPTNSKNTKYYNTAAFSHTLTGNNLSGSIATALRLDYFLLNAKNARTPASSVNTLYPTAPTLIGYVHNSWTTSKETDISTKATTIAGISNQKRMSFPNSQANPLTPTSITNFSNVANLTDYDPAYNPFDGRFYASNLSTAGYLLPTQTSTFTAGTKYLLIRVDASSRLNEFTLNLPNSTGITNLYVKWERTADSNWGSTAPWYDAKVDWQLANGASRSTPTATAFPIKINTAAFTVPDPSLPGNIYFNIQFTGTILLNDIVIT